MFYDMPELTKVIEVHGRRFHCLGGVQVKGGLRGRRQMSNQTMFTEYCTKYRNTFNIGHFLESNMQTPPPLISDKIEFSVLKDAQCIETKKKIKFYYIFCSTNFHFRLAK